MDANSNVEQIPILIYFNFRGQLQPTRNLFCYLEIPFYQIHIERIEQQRKQLPREVLAQLSKFKLDKTQLPALIHENLIMKGELPIMTYACRKFNRSELLGQNIQTRVKLQQILQIYFAKYTQTITQFLKLGDYAAQEISDQQLEQQCEKALITILEGSGFIKPICEYLHKQQSRKYILGQITILDFLFFQSCFFVIGSFYANQQVYHQRKHETAKKNDGSQHKQSIFYLDIMNQYLQSFAQEPFYIKNKQFLQKFTICSTLTSESRKKGLKKFWLADPKFIY